MVEKLLHSGLRWEKKEFRRNEFLKISGSTDTQIYFVEKGSIRIFMTDENEERIIRFGYTGNIIVSLDSFLSGKPSEFYIQAIKKTTVRIASKKDFYEFIYADEEHLKFWISVLEDLVIQQIEREKDLLIHSPGERYARVLNRSPKLFQEIPGKYIANYLRMSPETLSRLKKS
ncbi:Crp/Fnr family transcriptional regulator [Chryseobacterium indologenes]|uniref:Crp/Fnr family transcriptional regulator n=1 Tax=Chryseobacterium indologenes TaxID=253 RepID=A0A0N1KUF7_CHRID|nr:Crp/Fnr family transcriptional regulator [Chryseobacterium indologenes]KPE52418.1 Crp/Fnr family transcriptional regulator [Chryseobacterium indologenes]